MTGAEIAQIITAVGFLITACTSAGAMIQSRRNGKKVAAIDEKATMIADNVMIIEKATNSMKDALVLATAKASVAEGTAAGIVEGHAAGLEQGRQEIRPADK